MSEETRPVPPWAGDVHTGVDAWTHGRGVQPDEQQPDGPPRHGRSGGSGRSGRRSTERRPRRERRPPPEDAATVGPPADPESVARTILLDQLAGRARSRQELSDKLASKDVPGEVAARVLDRFEEVGLVDDEAFARTWVSQRGAGGTSRSLARRALAQELRRKGVDAEVASTVLDEVDPAAEETAARMLVHKRLRTLTRVDDTTATRRLVGMLARKGYPSGLAFTVVREELAAADRGGSALDDVLDPDG